jgi:hypothetical protein
MKFTEPGIKAMEIMLDKMQRYYAFAYEVPKESVAFVIKGQNIHVMIDGRMKESIIPKYLSYLGIHEETGEIIRRSPPATAPDEN